MKQEHQKLGNMAINKKQGNEDGDRSSFDNKPFNTDSVSMSFITGESQREALFVTISIQVSDCQQSKEILW